MRNLDSVFKKSVMAAALGSALMGLTVAAQAGEIQLRPTATDGITNEYGSDSLDAFFVLAGMSWTSVNNTLPRGITLPPFNDQQWGLNIIGAPADGASFSESFTMHLLSTCSTLNVANQCAAGFHDYGAPSGSGNFRSTHVSMVLTLSGVLDDFSANGAGLDNDRFSLDYSSAVFDIFFDADGISDNGAVTQIAHLEGTGSSTSFQTFGTDVRADLEWTATFETVAPDLWLHDGDPFEDPDSCTDPLCAVDPNTVFKITQQDVIRTEGTTIAGNTRYTFTSDGPATGSTFFRQVPEPASLGLLGIGLAAMGAAGWKRRKES